MVLSVYASFGSLVSAPMLVGLRHLGFTVQKNPIISEQG